MSDVSEEFLRDPPLKKSKKNTSENFGEIFLGNCGRYSWRSPSIAPGKILNKFQIILLRTILLRPGIYSEGKMKFLECSMVEVGNIIILKICSYFIKFQYLKVRNVWKLSFFLIPKASHFFYKFSWNCSGSS